MFIFQLVNGPLNLREELFFAASLLVSMWLSFFQGRSISLWSHFNKGRLQLKDNLQNECFMLFIMEKNVYFTIVFIESFIVLGYRSLMPSRIQSTVLLARSTVHWVLRTILWALITAHWVQTTVPLARGTVLLAPSTVLWAPSTIPRVLSTARYTDKTGKIYTPFL